MRVWLSAAVVVHFGLLAGYPVKGGFGECSNSSSPVARSAGVGVAAVHALSNADPKFELALGFRTRCVAPPGSNLTMYGSLSKLPWNYCTDYCTPPS